MPRLYCARSMGGRPASTSTAFVDVNPSDVESASVPSTSHSTACAPAKRAARLDMASTPSRARPSLARARVAQPRDADLREDGHARGARDASTDARHETHAAVDMRRRE